MPITLFGLDAGGIVDDGLRVMLAGLTVFVAVCSCGCEVSPPSLLFAGNNLRVSNLTMSSLDILLCAVDG